MDQFIADFLLGKYQQLHSQFFSCYSTLINKTGGILSQEKLNAIQSALKGGELKDAVDNIEEALAEAKNAFLDVAVIGESGTGKSSFINSLRGLSQDDEEAAAVGVVETTMEKTPYQHPKYPKVTFWDCPGTGTPNFLPETYVEKMEFAKFDIFIIIACTRFTYKEVQLAQEIKKMGKKFYFVRTKVDSDLYNEKVSKPKSFNKERVLQQIQDNCLANLSSNGMSDTHVFLISNFDLDDFDFPTLEETLLKELPAHKRHIFMLLIPCMSDTAIEIKRNFLQTKLWLETLTSSVLSIFLHPSFTLGFDLSEQEKCLNLYRSHFCLDDKCIEETAKNLGISVSKLRSSIKSSNFLLLTKDDSIVAKVMKYFEACCSTNGGLPSTFQLLKTYFLRLKFLNTVADDAKIILRKTLEKKIQRE
ncbi:PREDICTED: interferon-inducible GTPase 1-like [Chrysochloris asiatica]|uniref:Interferon-inducible GTPase 1-like n=1 Tax=Chrysochloris asiatica TaxID=185453 RepID=A0A9B0X012_CHRAS|nr:PREDICTED: interferon-inducible GTPase 1-like [Chrysochloris asiatica]